MGKKKKGCLLAMMVAAFVIGGCVGDITQDTMIGDRLPDNHEQIDESCGSSVNNTGCHPGGIN